jgi:hypothetical protein
MGGTSSSETKNTVTRTTPTIGAGLLDNLLGKVGNVNSDLTGAEDAALRALAGRGAAGNPFAPQVTGIANTLLAGGGPDRTGMINDAYSQYTKALAPFANGDYVNPASNPALQGYLSTINNDVTNQVNGMFAGAGRDLSGANLQTLSRGIAQGEAPVLADAYNTARNNQLSAIDNLYGAGGTTAGLLSNFDQTRLANQQAGIGAASAANEAGNYGDLQVLAAEAQRRGIPLQTLAAQYGMVLPTAQAFATGTGTSTEQTNVPLADKLAGWTAMALGMAGKSK